MTMPWWAGGSPAPSAPGAPDRPDRCDTPPVPTDIYFTGGSVRITVGEEPSQVADAYTSAQGLPFRLTDHGSGAEVYINPGMMAFWSASEPAPEPEPESEPPQPGARHQTVTDIWGNPIRRKPRSR